MFIFFISGKTLKFQRNTHRIGQELVQSTIFMIKIWQFYGAYYFSKVTWRKSKVLTLSLLHRRNKSLLKIKARL